MDNNKQVIERIAFAAHELRWVKTRVSEEAGYDRSYLRKITKQAEEGYNGPYTTITLDFVDALEKSQKLPSGTFTDASKWADFVNSLDKSQVSARRIPLHSEKPASLQLINNSSKTSLTEMKPIRFQTETGATVPLYANLKLGTDRVDMANKVKDQSMPKEMIGVENPIAYLVPDRLLEPEFRLGTILYMAPFPPPVIGDGVLVRFKDGTGALRQFEGRENGQVLLFTTYPEKRACHMPETEITEIYTHHLSDRNRA